MGEDSKGYTFTDRRGGDRGDSSPQQGTRGSEGCAAGDLLPEIDFSTLILSFASATMISLGRVPDPVTGQFGVDLALARQNIDIISLLREKTEGNLLPEEKGLIEGILHELRLCYVEAKKGKE